MEKESTDNDSVLQRFDRLRAFIEEMNPDLGLNLDNIVGPRHAANPGKGGRYPFLFFYRPLIEGLAFLFLSPAFAKLFHEYSAEAADLLQVPDHRLREAQEFFINGGDPNLDPRRLTFYLREFRSGMNNADLSDATSHAICQAYGFFIRVLGYAFLAREKQLAEQSALQEGKLRRLPVPRHIPKEDDDLPTKPVAKVIDLAQARRARRDDVHLSKEAQHGAG
jgi:hypothetical protein